MPPETLLGLGENEEPWEVFQVNESPSAALSPVASMFTAWPAVIPPGTLMVAMAQSFFL